MFAIVDIETTGGNAATSGITEIAVALHNGQQVTDWFHTLVNPQQSIPRYITALTGITNDMVAHAPVFEEVAPQLLPYLEGNTFVAHNVNFDYSFVAHALQQCGYRWAAKKLCTVRYARKVFPGQPSYSLGRLCAALGIPINNRHRATGDVAATVQLFNKILLADEGQQQLQAMLKGRNPETYLPMNLPLEQVEALPYSPGVYYFYDQAGKLLYIGKARNLKYRVKCHFTNNATNQRKQDFIRKIYKLSFTPCATEMMAIVLEELEIKKHWPPYNRSQKQRSQLYALYTITDQRGYLRLAVEKFKHSMPAILCLHQQKDCYEWGRKLLQIQGLCEPLLFAQGKVPPHVILPDVQQHNDQLLNALQWLKQQTPNMLIAEPGYLEQGEAAINYYLIKNGQFAGMHTLPGFTPGEPRQIVPQLTPYPDNAYVKSILYKYAAAQPKWVMEV